jgi:hypothetical protein
MLMKISMMMMMMIMMMMMMIWVKTRIWVMPMTMKMLECQCYMAKDHLDLVIGLEGLMLQVDGVDHKDFVSQHGF